MSEFRKRTLSGIVYVAVVVACIFIHPVASLVLLSAIYVVGMTELKHLNQDSNHASLYNTAIIGGLVMLVGHYVFASENQRLLTLLFTTLIFILFVQHLFSKNSEESNDSLKNVVFSTLYLWLPLAMAIYLMYAELKWQPFVLFSLFVFIWANDTFAYLFGKWLGKHKLLPRISPKKTIEGFVGGLLGTVSIAYLVSTGYTEFNTAQWCIIGAIVSISGTIGDLFQSSLKRTAGVKDSGNILPGHGGILDRLDSFFFAAPATYFYILIFT